MHSQSLTIAGLQLLASSHCERNVLNVGISAQTGKRVAGGLGLAERAPIFRQEFAGTGTGVNDRDRSIVGNAYLTYTVPNNATYDATGYINFQQMWWVLLFLLRSSIHVLTTPLPVFVNLYYEFNNYLLDFVFPEKPNRKCDLYGKVHRAFEKTNLGG
ncbi:hypothetical protein DXG03_004316 [Asterophora parasitica]|uniref:Uncharacterized protein n=1 Tax=Asterophora parasitica TaxID=117018 RepID=A0A9P7K6D3_9AGAR|nr:hypothetical protein DXG03_004316 [Asterophora parasitica]